ncbi:Uncharacterised protein (plasmid) [Mesomycoplasma conjunctivae]|uniref:Uncharacterized protein n=1 Tax=Mycoplasmopsis fermentans (strain M64) TaxID=943945 RepID=A0AB32XBH7_MYCFM|nr:Hypothetical Protein MfeM64YM_0429 [Mycoplasmopsis fermentans M64]RMX35703.1 putative membrane protein [Mycoplasmopsis fermentans MF-I1]RMX35709.1 putative membrane protein [Mycoplasmopsis fermentans MF-I2]VEU64152.1 Uncharacterised protein [Mycoplasmopsis fermentans]VEU67592.1 Uncharacterised protein [Mesomycoplasma conjunctivae]
MFTYKNAKKIGFFILTMLIGTVVGLGYFLKIN